LLGFGDRAFSAARVDRTLPARAAAAAGRGYRNGVGYFERGGEVDGEQVSFKMRQRMVGDFLATSRSRARRAAR